MNSGRASSWPAGRESDRLIFASLLLSPFSFFFIVCPRYHYSGQSCQSSSFLAILQYFVTPLECILYEGWQ